MVLTLTSGLLVPEVFCSARNFSVVVSTGCPDHQIATSRSCKIRSMGKRFHSLERHSDELPIDSEFTRVLVGGRLLKCGAGGGYLGFRDFALRTSFFRNIQYA